MSYLSKNDKIFIAGAKGMVGNAITRVLREQGYQILLLPSQKELNLIEQKEVRGFLAKEKPDVIVIAAAKVGGIFANATYPAEFLYDNLMIASNTIHEAHRQDINRILFLGSSCIYPKYAPQPIQEKDLLTGSLEPTNEAYAVAKIAGLKMCHFYAKQYGRKYIAAMPCNLYGPGDRYHVENSHVIPALIQKFHLAKEEGAPQVTLWGSGKALREFLFVDDLALALLHLLKYYDGLEHINIGSDEEVTIAELGLKIKEMVGYRGKIVFDTSKPEGPPRKKIEDSKMAQMGWKPQISLERGLKIAYEDFCKHIYTISGEGAGDGVAARS